ncbi:dopa 4 [Colletotrichum scovillei]|nr:dopa 4 [Colletotrichum scovillei]
MMDKIHRSSTDSSEASHTEDGLSESFEENEDPEKALLPHMNTKTGPRSVGRETSLLKLCSKRPSLVTFLNISLFLVSFTLWLWPAPLRHPLKTQDYWKETSFYSPILERYDIPKISRVTNGTLYDTNPPSVLRQRIGKEADKEWHRIGDHVWPLIIGEADVRQLGKDPRVAVKIPEDLGYGSDAYIAQTEVFHHLHCLDMLRREVSYEHYYEPKEGPRPGGAQHQAHIGHCFDILAQAIKCTGHPQRLIMTMVTQSTPPTPQTDLKTVVEARTREWHFHIYFLLQSPTETAAALALRDAVLRLRRDGAFVAVPLFRVNEFPIGPHPAGSYEIWVPDSSFSDVFFYLAANRGNLSVLVHPLTSSQRRDHETRNAWMGTPWPIYLDSLPSDGDVPFQYPELGLGWSTSPEQEISLEERLRRGAKVEALLADDPEAAPAPKD